MNKDKANKFDLQIILNTCFLFLVFHSSKLKERKSLRILKKKKKKISKILNSKPQRSIDSVNLSQDKCKENIFFNNKKKNLLINKDKHNVKKILLKIFPTAWEQYLGILLYLNEWMHFFLLKCDSHITYTFFF